LSAGELRFNDFAATQAGGADADAFSLAGNFGVDRPQVDVPAPLGHVVGVADAVSRLRLLAADFTLLCHDLFPDPFQGTIRSLNFTGQSSIPTIFRHNIDAIVVGRIRVQTVK
jgi:hypothetical protein